MAFASTITGRTIFGNKAKTYGTFTNTAGTTGGNIDTGLRECQSMLLQHTGSAVVGSAPAVNETLPVDGSAVTIVTVGDADGIWEAFGTLA